MSLSPLNRPIPVRTLTTDRPSRSTTVSGERFEPFRVPWEWILLFLVLATVAWLWIHGAV